METRTLPLRLRSTSGDDGERIIEGLAVPYGEIIELGDYREQFAAGAFADASTALAYVEHGHRSGALPVGSLEATDTADGLTVRMRISATAAGDELYALVRDQTVADQLGLSVGFIADEATTDNDGLTTITRASLIEVSVTAFPAYPTTAITGVRHQGDPMPDTDLAADLADLRHDLTELTRRVDTNGSTAPPGAPLPFRSYGELVKQLATRAGVSRDQITAVNDAYAAAADAHRADPSIVERIATRDAATTADGSNVVPTWINRDIKLVDRGRTLLNLWSKEPLPAEGMTINYPTFGTATGDVGKQATENTALNYIELGVATGSAEVETYGGYSSLSRQAIERASVAYLNKVLAVQRISYGKVTNAAVGSLLAATWDATDPELIDISATVATGSAWTDAAISALGAIWDNSAGLQGDFWVMGLDAYKLLAAVEDTTGRPMFVLNGDGSNSRGTLNVRGFAGSVSNLPVVVDPTITGSLTWIASADAMTVQESAGAPWSLTDESIITLTKDFSLYGYMALAVNDAKGVVPVKVAA